MRRIKMQSRALHHFTQRSAKAADAAHVAQGVVVGASALLSQKRDEFVVMVDQSRGFQCTQSEVPSWKDGAPFSRMSEFTRISGLLVLSVAGFSTTFFQRVGDFSLLASK